MTDTESKTFSVKITTIEDEVTREFSGSVIDGPVIGATLMFYDRNGRLLKTEMTDGNARYRVSINAGANVYPLTIEASGGTNLVTGREIDFKLLSVITDPSVKHANVNPFSTLIVQSARSMVGGLNTENLDSAKSLIVKNMNFGLDSRLVADPITSEINDLNIGVIVKSSEVLAEMIRRTHESLEDAGTIFDINSIVKAIADDMTDGELDGAGGATANKQIALVSTLVSGKVLIEALSNNLNVNGSIATLRMDNAIAAVNPQATTSSMTANVRINPEQLQQTKMSVDAGITLLPSIELKAIRSVLNILPTDSLPVKIKPIFPADKGKYIDEAIEFAAIAIETKLDKTNQKTHQFKKDKANTNQSTTIILSWTAPIVRSDSSPLPLSEIGGYKIYSGTDPDNLAFLFDTNDSSVNEYTIRNLAPEKYYYAITAYNQSGTESEFSKRVSKTINSL